MGLGPALESLRCCEAQRGEERSLSWSTVPAGQWPGGQEGEARHPAGPGRAYQPWTPWYHLQPAVKRDSEPSVAATTKPINSLPGGHGGNLASLSPVALAFISGNCMIPGLEIIKL